MTISLPILNRMRHGDIEDTCRHITLEQAVCIANREADTRQWSCEDCECFGHDDDGGEPEYAVRWPICYQHKHIHHLKGFPFKRAPRRCFQLSFWASAYAATDHDNYPLDGPYYGAGNNAVLDVWHRADRYGRYFGPIEPQTEQWETDGGCVSPHPAPAGEGGGR